MKNDIGIVGTGRMGTAFAQRLLETGHSVTVWNRSPERTAAAVDAGAKAASNLETLAKCDIIIFSLIDSSAVSTVIDQLVTIGLRGRLIIEMSTLLPAEEVAIALTVTSSGAEFVDCPVGGTVGPALKGQLLGMAGGTASAFGRAKPVLDQLCRRVEHLGPAGSGARMKLAVNLPLALYWQTLGESLALLRNAGISSETAISLIADSSAGPTVLKNRTQVAVDTLNGSDQPGTFDIAGLAKDLRLALSLAKSEGRDLPLAQIANTIYERILKEGLGGFDGASLSKRSAQ
jgi:3-hydroxyisobutyrate dehydrogenase